jgi:hypothetical protein
VAHRQLCVGAANDHGAYSCRFARGRNYG